ncbi:MAG: hypothetical protein QOG85_1651 [Gaiellaceae bacterium]|jgi:hypothetical protein|nr:hypothetical protein [Gaiellaceae bacterium]
MHTCSACRGEVQDEFRFCPHCGKVQRTKIIEHFRGLHDLGDGWLRVSLYLGDRQHARVSVWHGNEAEAAISLDPDEMRRLGRFLLSAPEADRGRIARVLARL